MKNLNLMKGIGSIKNLNKDIRSRNNFVSVLIILFLFSTASVQMASAQYSRINQYAAKFICGESSGQGVVKGLYESSVSIHNPEYKSILIKYKVAVGLPGGKQGQISPFKQLKLGPDGAVKFTCKDFRNMLGPQAESTSLLTGFFVILSERPLDVVSVVSSSDSKGLALDIIEVSPKLISPPRLPDLIVSAFCIFKSRTAIATIKNIGSSFSPPSTTRIIMTPMSNGGTSTGPPVFVDLQTPGIAPGNTFTVETSLPKACFQPNCGAKAVADFLNEVNESSESNNKSPESVPCIG